MNRENLTPKHVCHRNNSTQAWKEVGCQRNGRWLCAHTEQPLSRLLCTTLATIATLHLCHVTVNIPLRPHIMNHSSSNISSTQLNSPTLSQTQHTLWSMDPYPTTKTFPDSPPLFPTHSNVLIYRQPRPHSRNGRNCAQYQTATREAMARIWIEEVGRQASCERLRFEGLQIWISTNM